MKLTDEFKISGEIDVIEVPNGRTQETIEHEWKAKAVEMAMKNGAQEGTVKIVEVEAIPVLYATNHATRIIIKAVIVSKILCKSDY
jgi:hypothetical protein